MDQGRIPNWIQRKCSFDSRNIDESKRSDWIWGILMKTRSLFGGLLVLESQRSVGERDMYGR